MITFAIVTITYNAAHCLKRTVDSVMQQTYPHINHYIVDGKSKDDTVAMALEYQKASDLAANGHKVVVKSEADRGLYDAMNKGLSMATGDVIGILNSDDFYTDETVLEHIVQALEQTGAEAVYGDIHYVAADNLNRCLRYYSSRGFSRWTMRLGFMPAHPSFYCRREVYERHGLFDTRYKVAADFELLLRLIFVGNISTTYIHKDCVTMRDGGASNANLRSRLRIMRDHRQALRRNHVRSSYAILSLRYIYKLGEIIISRMHPAPPLPAYITQRTTQE